MKKYFIGGLMAIAAITATGQNIQLHYDFGRNIYSGEEAGRQKVTATLEQFKADDWGSWYYFVDFDLSSHFVEGAYTEISREFKFGKTSPFAAHIEYDGGVGIWKDPSTSLFHGYGINHAALVGLNYCLHTADYKNIFNLELLYKYILDDYNKTANKVPLQFTFVWGCDDFCTAPGLRFSGFLDIWGQKLNVYDRKTDTYTDPTKQSFVLISEPQLWYNVGRWFKCPYLHIGTEIEISYNFTGKGFMCNPCLGIKWTFD